jgi:translocation and assembly module TamB
LRKRLSARGLRVLEVIIIIILIAASAPPLYFLNRRLDARMEAVKQEAIAALEARIGHRISYASISPSIFGFLAVRELKVYSRATPDAVILRVNRIKIYYNILAFFRNKRSVDALKAVQLSNSQFDIDRDRDRELLSLLKQLGNSGGDALPELKISGANISLRYTSGTSSITLSKLFFEAGSQADTYTLSIRSLVAYQPRKEGYGSGLQSRVRIGGRLDRRWRLADLSVRIYSLSTEFLSLTRQTFQVSYKEDHLTVTKVQDRSPLDIQFLLDIDNGELRGNFKSENYRPANALEFTGLLQPYNRLLNSGLTGSGSFTYESQSGGLSYEMNLEGLYKDSSIPLDLRVITHLSGDERICYFEPLVIRSNRGSVEFSGNILIENFFPAGTLKLIDVRTRNGQPVNAAFILDRNRQRLTARGTRLSIGATGFENFNLTVSRQERELAFSLSSSLARTRADNTIRAEGNLRFDPAVSLSAAASLEGVPLSIIYRLISAPGKQSMPLERRLENLTLAAEMQGETDFRHFALNSETVRVGDLRNAGNALLFNIQADHDHLEVSQLTMDWNKYRLSGNFRSKAEEDETALSASLLFEDFPYEFSGSFRPGKELVVEGSYGLRAGLRFSGTASPSLQPASPELLTGTLFTLKTARLPVPFKRGLMLVSLDVEGIDTEKGVYAVSRLAELRNIPFIAPGTNSLVFSASLMGDRLEVKPIRYSDRLSSLRGEGSVTLKPAAVTAGFFTLEDPQSREKYALNFTLGPRSVDAALDFYRSPLAHIGALAVSGDLSGRISVSGDRAHPLFQAEMKLEDGRLNLDPLEAELAFNFTNDQFVLTRGNIAYLSHRIVDARGRFETAAGNFSFNSGYQADYFGKKLSLDLSLTGKPGTLIRRDISLFDSDMAGILRLANIRVEERPAGADWLFDLRTVDAEFLAEGGPEKAIRFRYAESGAFQLLLEHPLPIRGTFQGRATRAMIDSSFDISALEMSIINTLVRTDIFQFTSGLAQGSVSISGPINDPDFYGILGVRSSEMEFALSPNSIGPINGRLVFDEKSFIMERLESVSGQTPFAAEGIFYMDHWVPKAFELTFEADTAPGIWIRYVFGPIFTDGYALGTIKVRGEDGSTWIEGDLLINSVQIATVKAEEPAEMNPIWVDLKFTTGRRVEFYWPSISFPIIRAYADQGEKISLSLDGDSGMALLRGDVEIRGGEIFYFDRSFYLKEGSITFGESVDEFDPRIKALAEIRERDENNEEIKIYLETNNRLSEFSPRFYSVPSRPDIEIMDLISGSIYTRLEERGLGVSAVLLTSEVVSQFGILQPFERAVREFFGLDLFSVRTQVVQNVLLRGLLGEKSTVNPVNPLDNTTLSLGKYLGTDLFVEMLVRFQSTEPWSADTGFNRIQTEGELNFEWETPFFLLEWSIVPQHPEDLFVTDNTLGLKWKFSY